MKRKIKFENIFVVLSIVFVFGCIIFYGNRLVKYYRVFNPKTESGEKVEVFSATVRKDNPVVTEGEGLYAQNGDFVFKGEDVNNYVLYAGKTWRIMQVYLNGQVKLVLDIPLAEVSYDNQKTTYEKSYIHSYIKDSNNLKLNYDDLEEVDICLDELDDISKLTCENKMTDKVSILGLNDYINSLSIETNKSYINNTKNIWLYNKNSEGLAWNIANGKLSKDELSFEYSVKPVITLKGTAHCETGKGTENDPYIVKVGK